MQKQELWGLELLALIFPLARLVNAGEMCRIFSLFFQPNHMQQIENQFPASLKASRQKLRYYVNVEAFQFVFLSVCLVVVCDGSCCLC